MGKHKKFKNAFDDESHDASSGSESDSSTDTDQRRRKRRHDDTEKMLKKKRRKASTESEDDYRHKKKKKYLSDLKKKKHRKAEKLKRLDSDRKKKRKNKETKSTKTDLIHELSQTSTFGPHPPITIDKSLPVVSITPINAHIAEPVKKSFAPMTKEQYDKQQSVLRRVVDPETGRTRLIKGDGEIMEEIVSRERHKAINKLATQNDGYSFQAGLRKLK